MDLNVRRLIRERPPILTFSHNRVVFWFLVGTLEVSLLGIYFALSTASITEIRYLAYPFVWINAVLWAVIRSPPPRRVGQWSWLPATVSLGYLSILFLLGGIIVPGDGGTTSLEVSWLAPGWGPMLTYHGPNLNLYLVPFKVIGYGGLTYLLSLNLLATNRSVLFGPVGFATCVGCSAPVLMTVIGGIGGFGAAVIPYAYDLGTILFVVAVALFARNLSS